MTYASAQLITTAEYNGFIGSAVNSTSGNINSVWSTGNGQFGYGQTALSQSATSAGLITGTQWASLVNTMNSVSKHQSGGSGIAGLTVPASGGLNIAQSTLPTALATLYTNKALYNSQGTQVNGSAYSPVLSVGNTYAAQALSITRTITFSLNSDAMRYFFNAGGQIKLTHSGSGSSSTRSSDLAACINSIGTITIGGTTNSGRTGTGNTQTANNTGYGYWNCGVSASFNAGTTITQITSTGYTYTGDYALVSFRTNGAQGSNADHGTIMYIDMYLYAAAHDSTHLFNQSISTTWTNQIDIIPPESTNLTNTWGTVGTNIVVS